MSFRISHVRMLSVLAAILIVRCPAFGALYNIQYGKGPNYTSQGIFPGSTHWTQFSLGGYNGGLGSDVPEANGSGPTIHIVTLAINYDPYVYGDYYDTGSSNPTSNSLLAGYFFDYSSKLRYAYLLTTITGLTPGAAYDLVTYSAGDQMGQGTVLSGALSGSTSASTRASFEAGVNYVINTGVIASATGEITFDTTDIGTNYAILNGLQIRTSATVPEPGMAAVLTLACAGLTRRRTTSNPFRR